MMKIVEGDLLKLADQGHFDVIVHGCNCFNRMGAGIARTIAQRYPAALEADRATTEGSRKKLGEFTMARVETSDGRPFTIVNAYTQYHYGSGRNGDRDLFEYQAFKKILLGLKARQFKDQDWEPIENPRFGFPLIGCGLAGGDEQQILEMLEQYAPLDTTVVKYVQVN